jgi:hypothetical protein
MKVEFKDTFFESVEKLVWYDTKLWKVWDLIRRGIPNFFKNIYLFRRELYNHQWYDYRYTLEMLYRSLNIMVDKLEKDGIEEDISRGKKVAKIKRAIQILKNINNDNYISMAEAELGELVMNDWEFEDAGNGCRKLVDKDTDDVKLHNRKVFDRTNILEEQEWKELWKIFEGQDMEVYRRFEKTLTDDQKRKTDSYKQWLDGSDMRGWWD